MHLTKAMAPLLYVVRYQCYQTLVWKLSSESVNECSLVVYINSTNLYAWQLGPVVAFKVQKVYFCSIYKAASALCLPAHKKPYTQKYNKQYCRRRRLWDTVWPRECLSSVHQQSANPVAAPGASPYPHPAIHTTLRAHRL